MPHATGLLELTHPAAACSAPPRPAPRCRLQGSSRRDEQEVRADRVKIVVVDQKLAPQKE